MQSTVQYLKQYRLKYSPFRLSPDPTCFYPAESHITAETIITHAIMAGEGFMVLSGQAGLGKTLILRRILKKLPANKLPIIILSPAMDSEGLLQTLLNSIGADYTPDINLAQLVQTFQDKLIEMASDQKIELFIVIDEAQNMPLQTLEQLRMLSNLETSKRKLMQILLVGQLELEDLLQDPRLGQLAQRIVVHERLTPLGNEEVSRYVSYRLHLAGRPDMRLAPGTEKLLRKASGGIPRLINRIMDRTLLMASMEPPTIIGKKYIRTALNSMNNLNFRERRPLLLYIALGMAVALVCGIIFLYLSKNTDLLVNNFLSVLGRVPC